MSTADISQSKEKPRRIGRIVVGVVAIAIILIVFCVYSGIQTALTAERHYHAMLNAILACQAYVEQHDGEWPHSQKDIERLYPDTNEWIPNDAVHIDFDADPAILARQTSQTFTGIRVDRPVYSYNYDLDALIKVLRRFHDPTTSSED